MTSDHQIQWVTAAPLWSQAAQGPDLTVMRRPALLRFGSDAFMDDLQVWRLDPAGTEVTLVKNVVAEK